MSSCCSFLFHTDSVPIGKPLIGSTLSQIHNGGNCLKICSVRFRRSSSMRQPMDVVLFQDGTIRLFHCRKYLREWFVLLEGCEKYGFHSIRPSAHTIGQTRRRSWSCRCLRRHVTKQQIVYRRRGQERGWFHRDQRSQRQDAGGYPQRRVVFDKSIRRGACPAPTI